MCTIWNNQPKQIISKLSRYAFLLAYLLLVGPLFAEEISTTLDNQIRGDIGIASYRQSSITSGNPTTTQILPFVYFDYSRFFARIDTFGIKTLPVGDGYLEIAGKYSTEGFTPKGGNFSLLNERTSPVPIGVGTFQLTPMGGFFAHVYEDIQSSNGKMFEFTYAAQISLPLAINIYPMFSLDYKDRQYLGYFYGVSALQSQSTGIREYTPSGGVSPSAAFMFELPIAKNWILDTYLKRKWLATTITDSPLVTERHLDNVFTALNYRFE